MKILFLDQSGKLGGAELSLLDIANHYRDRCLVALFADGSFRELLEQQQIPVQVISNQSIQVSKESSLLLGLGSLGQILPLITRVSYLSRNYDLIYANTPKALVVGAIASYLSRRPLVYHLRDILSDDHFSAVNRRLIVTLANQFASLIIANSQATQTAFVAAGGHLKKTEVIYNGFAPEKYQYSSIAALHLRQQLGIEHQFVVGHFSRLSPWKGQHVLIEALQHCSENVVAIFVGDALFGEQDYVVELYRLIAELNLSDRVHFLGFRSDISQLMSACDLIAHTSTSPEPFGRVIVEAMLCDRPVVAAKAGGVVELINHDETGWLTDPGDSLQLAAIINQCRNQPQLATAIAKRAQTQASERFNLAKTQQKIAQLLSQVMNVY
jgi:glycosyltransferase involved in cell wall biosynthesis